MIAGMAVDITGQRFGRLVAVSHVLIKGRNSWFCDCDCGNKTVVEIYNLDKGVTTSCGCLYKKMVGDKFRKHGMSSTKIYILWRGMRNRCRNPNVKGYERYGGRGIKVDPRWDSFEHFLEDMGPKPSDEHALDRIDNNGDYTKENCKWSTKCEQAQNRRKHPANNSGKTGVTWAKKEKKWKAYITANGKVTRLGFFVSLEAAVEARKAAELQYIGKYLDH